MSSIEGALYGSNAAMSFRAHVGTAAFAPEYTPMDAQPAVLLPFPTNKFSDRVIFSRNMIDNLAEINPVPKNSKPVSLRDTSLPLEHRTLEDDPNWEYIPLDPIPEKTEWLGVKKDEDGKPIRSIMGSVVGRVRQPEIVIHAGDVKEDMVRITTYVRWDPQNPNPDLLELGTLVAGATGPEVKIEQVVQHLAANAPGMEYSGIKKRRVHPIPDEKLKRIPREEQVA